MTPVPEELLCPQCGRLLNRVTRQCALCRTAAPAAAPPGKPAVPPAPAAAPPGKPAVPPAPGLGVARGALSGVRWRRRRYDLVGFDGCIALVPAKRGRDAASLLRYSPGQLGTLDGGSRLVRDVEVVDAAVCQDRVSGRATVELARGGDLRFRWRGWPNRGVDAEVLFAGAFPRKTEQGDVEWRPRIIKLVAGVAAAVALLAGLVAGGRALFSPGSPRRAPAPPAATLPPAVQAAHQELAAACQPWFAATADLRRGDRPDPARLRPVVEGMRPHFDAAAASVAAYAAARDQLAVLQGYASGTAAAALKESSARIGYARDAVDAACRSAS